MEGEEEMSIHTFQACLCVCVCACVLWLGTVYRAAVGCTQHTGFECPPTRTFLRVNVFVCGGEQYVHAQDVAHSVVLGLDVKLATVCHLLDLFVRHPGFGWRAAGGGMGFVLV